MLQVYAVRAGVQAEAIHGNKSQNARQRALSNFKAKQTRVLVATDIAARGIDVTGIELVVNFDLPDNSEDYVHRIGRTGRAGRSGEAILFVTPRERHMLRIIERATRQSIAAMELPSAAAVNEQRLSRLRDRIGEVLGNPDLAATLVPFKNLIQQYEHTHETSSTDLAAAQSDLSRREHLGASGAVSGEELRHSMDAVKAERERG